MWDFHFKIEGWANAMIFVSSTRHDRKKCFQNESVFSLVHKKGFIRQEIVMNPWDTEIKWDKEWFLQHTNMSNRIFVAKGGSWSKAVLGPDWSVPLSNKQMKSRMHFRKKHIKPKGKDWIARRIVSKRLVFVLYCNFKLYSHTKVFLIS